MAGKDFRLGYEIEYIQGRAAEHDARFVTLGPLVLFSTETGDSWLLDPADRLAAGVARDGDPEEIRCEVLSLDGGGYRFGTRPRRSAYTANHDIFTIDAGRWDPSQMYFLRFFVPGGDSICHSQHETSSTLAAW